MGSDSNYSWIQSEWQKRGGIALLMLPFALLFRAAVAVRRAHYRARILPTGHSPVPVVVVGNITAGGTGKTPLVLAIVDLLQRNGRNPGVVARGYGRVPPQEHDPRGVVRVYPDIATPEHFGDEPVLVARRARVPVYISPDRAAAARALHRDRGGRRRARLRQPVATTRGSPAGARGPAAHGRRRGGERGGARRRAGRAALRDATGCGTLRGPRRQPGAGRAGVRSRR